MLSRPERRERPSIRPVGPAHPHPGPSGPIFGASPARPLGPYAVLPDDYEARASGTRGPITRARIICPMPRSDPNATSTALGSKPLCIMQSWHAGFPLAGP